MSYLLRGGAWSLSLVYLFLFIVSYLSVSWREISEPPLYKSLSLLVTEWTGVVFVYDVNKIFCLIVIKP